MAAFDVMLLDAVWGRVTHHFALARRFQMAGLAAVQGPSVACLYSPYSSSFACELAERHRARREVKHRRAG